MRQLLALTLIITLVVSGYPALSAPEGKFDQAYSAYEQTRAKKEFELGMFCLKKKNTELAYAHFRHSRAYGGVPELAEQFAKCKDQDSEALDEKSQADYDKKVEQYAKSISKELIRLADSCPNSGSHLRAYYFMEEASDLDPENTEAQTRLIMLAESAKDARETVKDTYQRGIMDVVAFDPDLFDIPFYARFPSSYRPTESWPMILHLHGAGDSGKNAAQYYADIRDNSGYIVCSASLSWSNEPRTSSVEQDEKAVLQIIDYMIEHYRVNPRLVVLTSHSAGGNLLYRLLSRHEWRAGAFIAFNSVFPNVQFPKHKKPNDKPIFLIVGKTDPARAGTTRAAQSLNSSGYRNVRHDEVHGIGHNDLPKVYDDIEQWLLEQCPNPNFEE